MKIQGQRLGNSLCYGARTSKIGVRDFHNWPGSVQGHRKASSGARKPASRAPMAQLSNHLPSSGARKPASRAPIAQLSNHFRVPSAHLSGLRVHFEAPGAHFGALETRFGRPGPSFGGSGRAPWQHFFDSATIPKNT